MPFHNILDLLALAAAIAVGRSNLKKQTIADQAALITALKNEVDLQDRRIKCLEEKLDGNAKLVEGRPVAPGHRAGSGKRATPPQTPENRNP